MTIQRNEEVFNSLTHGLGLALSLGGVSVLVTLASLRGSVWHIVGCSIFGASLITLYTASTLYHGARRERSKKILQVVDHVCVFLLIAGTYTPFTLTIFRGPWGWTLFGLIWAFAAVGVLLKSGFMASRLSQSVLPYVLMGWVGVIVMIKPILMIPTGGLILLVGGGLLYSVGVIFYTRDKIPCFHAVWHLFVLAGSTCHYFAILFYVLPTV
jgi:hemolysin III